MFVEARWVPVLQRSVPRCAAPRIWRVTRSVIVLSLLPLPAARAGLAPFAPKTNATLRGLIIGFTLLPLPPLQPEPGNHDRGQQERDHRARDRPAFAELTCDDGALVGQCRHQMR